MNRHDVLSNSCITIWSFALLVHTNTARNGAQQASLKYKPEEKVKSREMAVPCLVAAELIDFEAYFV